MHPSAWFTPDGLRLLPKRSNRQLRPFLPIIDYDLHLLKAQKRTILALFKRECVMTEWNFRIQLTKELEKGQPKDDVRVKERVCDMKPA